MRTRPLERPVAPAARNCFSSTRGWRPRCARWKARLASCTPPPMMITSAVLDISPDACGDHAPGPRPRKALLNVGHVAGAGGRVDQGDHVAAAPAAAQFGPQRAGPACGFHEAVQLR